MSDRIITCIVCPKGCMLSLRVDDGKVKVTGHACPRGESYGVQEAVEPMRSLTTTVRTADPVYPRLPVRTDGELPLRRLEEAMAEINKVIVKRAERRGAVILPNLLDLGVDVISCDDMPNAGGEK